MNKSIKTFTFAAIASIAFFACNDTGTNSTDLDCEVYDAASGHCKKFRGDKDQPPYDPENTLTISSDVKEWMDEQLASGNNDRRLINVCDLLMEYDSDTGIAIMANDEYGECGGICYYLGGRRVDVEEYNKWIEEFRKKREAKRRVSPIIGEIVQEKPTGWTALMTAKEIVELTEKYKGLTIYLYYAPKED